jgi:hypothetical protein
VVLAIGLWPLTFSDCEYECWGGGCDCLSFVNVVCCHVEVSAMGQSFIQSSSTKCMCVSLSVIKCNKNLLHLQ